LYRCWIISKVLKKGGNMDSVSRKCGCWLTSFLLACVGIAGAAPSASAGIIYDFESGSLTDWQTSTVPGGSGGVGVASHNGSQMAFVSHSSTGKDALSHDFTYL